MRSQSAVFMEPANWEKAGYGKDGKLSCAFHFPTTPAAVTDTESTDVACIPIRSKTFPGAKAPIPFMVAFGAAKVAPFQNVQ
jgi:hypothetical protein